MNAEFAGIDVKDVASLKDFINFEKEQVKQEALGIMIKNGKNEKVNFNQDVLKRAIKVRIDIAEKEAECYILVYEKMKKLLAEQDTETVRLNKYKKTLRDTSVKLAFLDAQREYIVGFLDYERMTAISGEKMHSKMMMEACNNFELDLIQIEKLYELIQREITNRSTKKGYNQLYNKTYLKHIEDKERNFEQEVNNVNISMGTVINSNYWRIEGIKNIYNVFQKEVSKKFGKDLSEYQLEEPEEKPIKKQPVKEQKMVATKVKKEEHYKQFKYDEDGAYDEEDYVEEQKPQKIELEKIEENQEESNSYSYEEEETFGHQYKLDDYDFLVNEEYDDDDYDKKNQEEAYKESDYEEDYDEVEDYENDDEEDDKAEQQPTPIIVARSNRQIKEEDEKEQYTPNHYNNSYYNDNSYNNYNDEDEDDDADNSYSNYNDNYDEDDDYNDNSYNNYNNYNNTYDDDYEEEEDEENDNDNDDYYEEEYDEEDSYKAYNTPSYGFKRSPYLDDDEDEEYENIYEYNYDDDEEEYRRQKLQNKTVISFDDEESIDMIIANSRKRSSSRRGGNKNLFKKLFKK